MAGRREVGFSTLDGLKLRGWFYSAGKKRPCVVMANGFSGTREQFLPDFADKFQQIGFGVLVYDNRHWGVSEGEPRNHTDPLLQARDYSSAYDFVTSLPEVDPEQVILWGSSMAGGNVIVAAGVDPRPAGVIAQVPFCSGEVVAAELGDKVAEMFQAHAAITAGKDVPMAQVVPLTKEEADSGNSQAILSGGGVWNFLEELSRRGIPYETTCTMQSLFHIQEHQPCSFVQRIAPRPLLMVVAGNDAEIHTPVQLEMYSKAHEPKQLHIVKGKGHFDVYYGAPFEENVKVQLEFLQRHFS